MSNSSTKDQESVCLLVKTAGESTTRARPVVFSGSLIRFVYLYVREKYLGYFTMQINKQLPCLLPRAVAYVMERKASTSFVPKIKFGYKKFYKK